MRLKNLNLEQKEEDYKDEEDWDFRDQKKQEQEPKERVLLNCIEKNKKKTQ